MEQKQKKAKPLKAEVIINRRIYYRHSVYENSEMLYTIKINNKIVPFQAIPIKRSQHYKRELDLRRIRTFVREVYPQASVTVKRTFAYFELNPVNTKRK